MQWALLRTTTRAILLSATILCHAAALAAPNGTPAPAASFDIPARDLGGALRTLAVTADIQILFDEALVRGRRSPSLRGTYPAGEALERLLAGSGLVARRGANGVVVIERPTSLGQTLELSTDQADDTAQAEPPAEDIIVTAQKREEAIQDVPIAISAFNAAALDDRKIEGGSELLRAVPNVTFSKGNFSMYNFSIRGIGTKAVSASTDPAVAVSFNNTPLIRNRLFEQEFFDVARVEVLRGPQGTLYGRNATGGVVNMIPNLPDDDFGGQVTLEAGNFESRRANGMINIPLTNTLAVRAAGAWTQRDGFDYNSFTGNRINGRDLWSTRLSALWEPTDDIRLSFIWQHFEEDDNRARTGKQLCNRDPGPETIGGVAVSEVIRPQLSQGCVPGSLYSDAAYGAPNALSFPHVTIADVSPYPYSYNPDGTIAERGGLLSIDPYAGVRQSRDLREVATAYDPVFRAKNDFFQLNLEFGLTDGLQLITQTAFAKDRYYSSQDYNRYVSNPIFRDTADPAISPTFPDNNFEGPTPGGFFTDPQLGRSNRMLSVDISRSRNEQWTQEIRLQSDWDGPVNFSLGGNYLDFKSSDDYFVFNNLFTFIAQYFYNTNYEFDFENGVERLLTRPCAPEGPNDDTADCIYVDPNGLGSINELGHNYFLSKNKVRTESWALFGEVYWQLADTLKLTGGLRYTDDQKTATPYPSQLLLGIGPVIGGSTGGRTAIGYPALPDIDQRWRRFSGRAVLDWKPTLSFTDETLVYGSFAHGYKGGGSNPPRVDIDPTVVPFLPLPETFAPEYVNAFEIGTKNSLMNGRLSLNATAFYYDYKNYQVSQIVDRISLNENFGARSMGLELEAAWRPSRAFRADANFGYLNTRIKDGARSIDVMDRTQGNEDWVVVRPWVQSPSNCIAPRAAVEAIAASPFLSTDEFGRQALAALCPGSIRLGNYDPSVPAGSIPFYALTGFTYDPLLPYDPALNPLGTLGSTDPRSGAPNGARGFYADLAGNELPNSPQWTFNLGAQYSLFYSDWEVTLRGDYYRQSKSYARIYNTEYDRLEGWDNVNVALTVENTKRDLRLQVYVKNLFDDAPITDFFTNSDDTGLTTNVFTLDPRIIGVSVRKGF